MFRCFAIVECLRNWSLSALCLRRRILIQLSLFELMLSVLFQNLKYTVAVRINELGERLEERKHHVVDEAQLHIQCQHPVSKSNIHKVAQRYSYTNHSINFYFAQLPASCSANKK